VSVVDGGSGMTGTSVPTHASAVPAQREEGRALRVLVVDASAAGDAHGTAAFSAAADRIELDRVAGVAGLTAQHVAAADCALLDLSRTGPAGASSLQALRRLAPELPVVVLTACDDLAARLAALRDGAQEVVVVSAVDPVDVEGVVRSAMERMRLEQRSAHAAGHDALTDLPNRALLHDRLTLAVERTRRTGAAVAVVLVDLDHFKAVNDSLGHAAGDALLIQAAGRLQAAMRPTDTLARLGGDEFVVVCDVEEADQAEHLAQRLREVFLAPFAVGEHVVNVTASVGVGVDDSRGELDGEALLRHADTAMYAAKQAGRDQVVWFDERMHRHAHDRFVLENALRAMARTGAGLSVAFQPVIDIRSGAPVMIEALARWTHPTRGPVPTPQMIAVAEAAGVVADVDLQVLDRALAELVVRRREHPLLTVSANVSGRTLALPHLRTRLRELLTRHSLEPDALTLEIVETALLTPGAAESLQRLRRTGVRVALDDFGTGTSSLSQFLALEADTLKLDGTFVQASAHGQVRASVLLRLVTAAATELGMTIIGEGVESDRELDVCRDLGVHLAQGHLWGAT
jgi:diguanylate cyclase (GGDEF)-like protein